MQSMQMRYETALSAVWLTVALAIGGGALALCGGTAMAAETSRAPENAPAQPRTQEVQEVTEPAPAATPAPAADAAPKPDNGLPAASNEGAYPTFAYRNRMITLSPGRAHTFRREVARFDPGLADAISPTVDEILSQRRRSRVPLYTMCVAGGVVFITGLSVLAVDSWAADLDGTGVGPAGPLIMLTGIGLAAGGFVLNRVRRPGYDDTRALVDEYHHRARERGYVVTPTMGRDGGGLALNAVF